MPKGVYARKIITVEHRKNLSLALKGRIFSEEHKKRLSESSCNRLHKKGYRNKKWIEKICPVCQVSFEILPCRKEQQFCSHKCSFIGRKKPIFPNRKRENNPRWKGGITKLRYVIWKSERYKRWRNAIFKKYNYTCQGKDCGIKKELQVHHTPYKFQDILNDYNIKTLKDALECNILWDENNGIVLCKKCHRKTYKFKGNQYVPVRVQCL